MKKHGARLAALVLLFSIVMVQTGCSRNLLETVRSWVRVGDVECTVSSPRYYASGELSPKRRWIFRLKSAMWGWGNLQRLRLSAAAVIICRPCMSGRRMPDYLQFLVRHRGAGHLHRDQPYTDAWTARKEYDELGGFAPGDYRAQDFLGFLPTPDASASIAMSNFPPKSVLLFCRAFRFL